jgi:hypothetical protein
VASLPGTFAGERMKQRDQPLPASQPARFDRRITCIIECERPGSLLGAPYRFQNQIAACASCISFNVLPLASFQSVRPLDPRPKTTAEASEGELNV